MSAPENPAAFPATGTPDYVHSSGELALLQAGMTLRDYFAAHCPQSWIDAVKPKTIGAVRGAMIVRGIIPADRAKAHDVTRSYTDADELLLLIALRWEYADAMLAERAK